jgi:plasmid stability protein
MVSITIRNLDESTKTRLRVRAAHRNRSMEEEARSILRQALGEDGTAPGSLAQAIARRFQGLDASRLAIAPREPMREPPRPVRGRRR